ncbi:MAG: SRPBCC family protein [Propionibacteriaceae bacterium]
MTRRHPELTHWPAGTAPVDADVFSHNELVLAAPPSQVWPWLVDARGWPRWYRNARRVQLPPAERGLALGVTFTWTTFATPISSKVVLDQPVHRLGWTWSCPGASGYHGWLLEPSGAGTRVVTEETQRGPKVARWAWVLPHVLWLGHAYWLHALARQVRRAGPGPVPGVTT